MNDVNVQRGKPNMEMGYHTTNKCTDCLALCCLLLVGMELYIGEWKCRLWENEKARSSGICSGTSPNKVFDGLSFIVTMPRGIYLFLLQFIYFVYLFKDL